MPPAERSNIASGLLALVMLTHAPTAKAVGIVQDGPASDAGLVLIRPSEPPAELAAMTRWHRVYRRQTTELRSSCDLLAESLRGLERRTLFPVPDGAVDLYLKRSLEELDRAARACRRGRVFEMVYRLQEADRAFRRMEVQLARYGLAP